MIISSAFGKINFILSFRWYLNQSRNIQTILNKKSYLFLESFQENIFYDFLQKTKRRFSNFYSLCLCLDNGFNKMKYTPWKQEQFRKTIYIPETGWCYRYYLKFLSNVILNNFPNFGETHITIKNIGHSQKNVHKSKKKISLKI